MHSRLKQVLPFILPALLLSMLLLASCENDLKKIKEVSAQYANSPADTTRGLDIIYSDSAIVKGHLLAPIMVHLEVADPVNIMPKGVKIVFYDEGPVESGNIVADSGVFHTANQKVEFYHHVVYRTKKGDVCQSDELIWDQAKKIVYSNKPVHIVTAEGNILNGINFTSDDKMLYPQMTQGTGDFEVTDFPGQ